LQAILTPESPGKQAPTATWTQSETGATCTGVCHEIDPTAAPISPKDSGSSVGGGILWKEDSFRAKLVTVNFAQWRALRLCLPTVPPTLNLASDPSGIPRQPPPGRGG